MSWRLTRVLVSWPETASEGVLERTTTPAPAPVKCAQAVELGKGMRKEKASKLKKIFMREVWPLRLATWPGPKGNFENDLQAASNETLPDHN